MALPTNVDTGRVEGRFIVGVVDGPDQDLDPDGIPAQGSVTFTASVPYLPDPFASPAPVTILKAPIVGVLDSDGYLCTPDPADPTKPGYRGLRLIATDDPDLSVQGWTWTVTYNFQRVAGVALSIASHSMALPSGSTVDLTTVVKVPSSNGIGIEQAEALAAAAGIAAQEAAAAAQEAANAAQATDSGVAALITTGPATTAAGDGRWTKAEDVSVSPGTGTFTKGVVTTVGDHAFVTRDDVNMAVVQGGGSLNENVIGGNTANVNTSTSNLDGAPTLTGTDGQWNFILSGYDNVVNGWAVIMNGFHNKVEAGGNHATISGGSIHSIGTNNYSTIGGGTGHVISDGGSGSTIGGGISNSISLNSSSATIAGGNTNSVTQMRATVGGGNANKASGNGSTVGGGDGNTAAGSQSTVPGGLNNTAAAAWSVATGAGAVASSNGMRSHGAMVTAPGDSQDSTVILKGDSTTATELGLSLHGSGGLVIPENTTWAISALIVARRTDADGENAAWRVETLVSRNAGSTNAVVGTPTVTPLGANSGNPWTVALTTYSAGNVNVRVVGEAGKTIRWLATLRIAHVSG